MKTTISLLDAMKAKHGVSDYKLAALLGVTRSQVSLYRTGKAYLSDEKGATVAADLGYPLLAVLAALSEERARTPAIRNAWRDAVKRLGGLAASFLLGIGLSATPAPSQAAFNNNQMGAQDTHMRTRRRKGRSGLATAAARTLSAIARYTGAGRAGIAF